MLNEFQSTQVFSHLFLMNWQKITLFLSGLFFGGAIDHVILALMNSPVTPYGLALGVIGNWGLAAADLALAAVLYASHQSLGASKRREQR